MQTQDAAVELRPGVFRPDWSVTRSPAARQALSGRAGAREGLLDKWLHALPLAHDRVWQAVLTLYGGLGLPPSLAELMNQTGLPEGSLVEALRALDQRDLLKLDDNAAIRYAYPFTEEWTGHTVFLRNRKLNSMCAIDALGTGAMLVTDVTVNSVCRSCGDPIRIATTDRGRAIEDVSPAGAMVWYDYTYGDRAASSCCQSIAFFCSDAHLQTWLEQGPGQSGMRLTVPEALEVGRALFEPVLAAAKSQEAR